MTKSKAIIVGVVMLSFFMAGGCDEEDSNKQTQSRANPCPEIVKGSGLRIYSQFTKAQISHTRNCVICSSTISEA